MFLGIYCNALPLKNHHDSANRKQPLTVDRTTEKWSIKEKVNSALIEEGQKWSQLKEKTTKKLTDSKQKVKETADQLIAKVGQVLAEEVAKWAAVGDQLEQYKETAKTSVKEKWDDLKEKKHGKNGKFVVPTTTAVPFGRSTTLISDSAASAQM